eukprot:CAMPEP_0183739866 /NCGR_PEP_ID=MMETSP0737-20130205/58236_1 /TAXON_ID=385413 /ORGANISM="Thalassiosira miniscula, Strain CCMP1093" /LENGTH=64 /DNA_ID=CAMNT_0025974773 /DNA_START=848 /DNA_END=1039 /DNA_ORIENTATION=+
MVGEEMATIHGNGRRQPALARSQKLSETSAAASAAFACMRSYSISEWCAFTILPYQGRRQNGGV